MDQIFNELSTTFRLYESKYTASKGMEKLLQVSAILNKFGFSNVIRTVEGFSQICIAPGYTIKEWATDKHIGANVDLQRKLLTFSTKSPYVESFIAQYEEKSVLEFKFENKIALGLGLANLWGTGVLSLDCDESFCKPHINVEKYELSEVAETLEVIPVLSFYSEKNIDDIKEKLKKEQCARITTGIKLVELSTEIFPAITFSDEAKSQLLALTGTEQYFPEVIRHFLILNQTMQSWERGEYNPQGISWSPESKTTMAQFGDKRVFKCSDGVSRKFNLHTKLFSANHRIYFEPILESKTVHIGYVGKHLPTVKYKT